MALRDVCLKKLAYRPMNDAQRWNVAMKFLTYRVLSGMCRLVVWWELTYVSESRTATISVTEKNNVEVGVTQSFEMLLILYQITRCQVDNLNMCSNQENDLGRECSTYGGDERCTLGFGGET